MIEVVTVDDDHYRNERNNYSNWPFAFWREFFQNSIDALGKHIKITHRPHQEGLLLPDGKPQNGVFISFTDDGTGMNAETLRKVFFRLGATTKKTTSTIGGNGKARILTCFSNHSYGIRTQDCSVCGSGSYFEIQENLPLYDGCEFWVDVDIRGKYGKVDLVESLVNYLSYSQMDCDIESDIPEVNEFDNWLYKRRHVRDLSFGGVYVNKSGEKKGELVVRVNGVPMFVKNHRADAQVVVELDPETNREILVSNRDSLHWQKDNELDEFLQEIAIDRHSALREFFPVEELIGCSDTATITYRKNRKCRIEADVNAENDVEDVEDAETEAENSDDTISEEGEVVSSPTVAGTLVTPSPNADWPLPSLGSLRYERVQGYSSREKPFNSLMPSFILYCDSDDATQKKAMWLFNPNSGNGNYFGATKMKLALLWHVAVEAAIEAWLDEKEKDHVSWRSGFLFSTGSMAMHRCNDNVHQLLLRPVNNEGSIRFRLHDREDLTTMLVTAVHEVSHMSQSYHDEDFTMISDRLMIRVMSQQKEILRRMTKAVKSVRKANKVMR